MPIDGNYTIQISTPMGKQNGKIILQTNGDSLSGSVVLRMGEQSFDGGTVSGDECAWTVRMSTPMGLIDAEFKSTISGDIISGQAKLPFGWVDFTGTRVKTATPGKEAVDKPRWGRFRKFALPIVILIAATIVLWIFSNRARMDDATAWKFFLEVITILPAVMVIMGLFSVFVSREQVVRYLGKTSGIKGMLLAIFFGSLPTGPLYVAFPLAVALKDKGARISNIVIFLSAWACIKIPQELVELQFLGFGFMLTRLVLTIISVALMGLAVEWLIEVSERKKQRVP